MSRDDLHKSRSKEERKATTLNERQNGADRVHAATTISPLHPEDDLDLCPPAAGISSLDFDPMSFQFSPLSSRPGLQRDNDAKWRKSAGCSSDSEPISSPNNNFSCLQSPDISPVLTKGVKEVTSKPISPKLRKKFFKTQTSASPPLLPSSSLQLGNHEALLEDGKVAIAPYQHRSPLRTMSQTSALTDRTQSAQNLPDPGKYHPSWITYAGYS